MIQDQVEPQNIINVYFFIQTGFGLSRNWRGDPTIVHFALLLLSMHCACLHEKKRHLFINFQINTDCNWVPLPMCASHVLPRRFYFAMQSASNATAHPYSVTWSALSFIRIRLLVLKTSTNRPKGLYREEINMSHTSSQ